MQMAAMAANFGNMSLCNDEDNLLFTMMLATIGCVYAWHYKYRTTKRRTKRYWVRPYLQRRQTVGRYLCDIKDMEMDPEQFSQNFHMNLPTFLNLFNKIEPHMIVRTSRRPDRISNKMRVMIALEFLANSVQQKHLACTYRVSKQVMGVILDEVCTAIINGLQDEALPKLCTKKWLEIAKDFDVKWNFPHCLGAIDGKHIDIQCPAKSGSLFYNYKGFFSIVLMAIADAHYRFLYYDVGAFGSEGDSTIFRETDFGKLLFAKNNPLQLPPWKTLFGYPIPFMYVADDAFPLTTNICKPFKPVRGVLREEECIFNYRLSRARRVIENAFGILAIRWRCLSKRLVMKPDRAKLIVEACCILHNFLMSSSSHNEYCPEYFIDHYDNCDNLVPGAWRDEVVANQMLQSSLSFNNAGRSTEAAKKIRQTLMSYFNSDEGSLSWQSLTVNRTC